MLINALQIIGVSQVKTLLFTYIHIYTEIFLSLFKMNIHKYIHIQPYFFLGPSQRRYVKYLADIVISNWTPVCSPVILSHITMEGIVIIEYSYEW